MNTYEEVIKFLNEFNILHLKVTDVSGKKISEFSEVSPQNLISKLQMFSASYASFGRVNFIGATESQYKQNWKESFHWAVVFNNNTPAVAGTQHNNLSPAMVAPGMVSANEASLMAQLAKLTLQVEMDKKFADLKNDLEKKIEGSKSKTSDAERMIDKYAPFMLPQLGFKMGPEQMEQMKLLSMMNGNGNQQQGIAGKNTGVNSQTGAKIELTDQEKTELLAVNEGIDKLTEKVSMDKLIKLIDYLNAQPGMVDTAIMIMNQNNNK